jgi:catechol 1,2-dioxygenase
MIVDNEQALTTAVLAVMERTTDPRLREIMSSLITHLHGFVRDVRLTEAEFREAAAVLNEIGKLASDSHNEMVLMAGSLGVSSLVCLLNNGNNGTTETSQNLLGPFWRMDSPRVENGGSIVRTEVAKETNQLAPSEPVLFVEFTVQDLAGKPVENAEVDIWQASPAGLYENQDPNQPDMNLRGRFRTDAYGQIQFRSVKPLGYAIPANGVVGRLLKAQNRHPFRPAHVHALIFKEGYKTLTSQIYADDDEHLYTDVQFGVTRALIGKFERHDSVHPRAADVNAPWYSLAHTFVLEPGEAKLPKAPIK